MRKTVREQSVLAKDRRTDPHTCLDAQGSGLQGRLRSSVQR